MECGDGSIMRAESSGGDNAHCVADCIEERHPRKQIAETGSKDESNIDIGKYIHDLGGARSISAAAEGSQLHVGKAQAHRTCLRNDQKKEDDNTETAEER